jgi:hypothetical protein
MNALDYLLRNDFIIVKYNARVAMWKESTCHYVMNFTLNYNPEMPVVKAVKYKEIILN